MKYDATDGPPVSGYKQPPNLYISQTAPRMLSWVPSIPYADPRQGGYWDPVTSTINWCEEVCLHLTAYSLTILILLQDYYATTKIAETVNTFTNLLFMYFAYLGIQNCRKHGHDTIFLVSFVGYLLVGSGSFLFHATLKYPTQLVDELSMIYTTCLMCYATFSYSRSRLFSLYLALGLVSLAIFITLYYHYLQDPAFHQTAYAILTAIVLLRAMYVMEFTLRRTLEQTEKDYRLQNQGRGMNEQQQKTFAWKDQRDRKILSRMWVMIAYGLTIFLGGFAIWHLDNAYCTRLRIWRRQVGLPWWVLSSRISMEAT